MVDINNNTINENTLKRIILFLSIILLVNPAIIYLVSKNILISALIPLLLLLLMLVVTENKKLNPLKVLFFNLILVVSFFLYSEAIFTYNFSEYIIDDLYEVKHRYAFNRPFLNKTFQDKEFIVQYKTNKQGFRIGSEDDPEIEVKVVDWLFIGDSFTQGAQVQYEDLYTSKLFDLFSDKIIINAGISGSGLPEEYNYFINEGKKLKPQKVFLQICNFNDFMNVNENKSDFSDHLMHISNFARFVLYGFKYTNPAELPLGRWTEPFYSDEKSNIDYNIFYKESSDRKNRDIKNFRLYLEKLNAAVKRNSGELIVLQIPTKEQVYYKSFDEVVNSFNIDVTKLDMYFPNRYLSDLCKEIGIKHIDLLNDFTDSQSDLFYQFDEHLNVLGHLQMANSISNYINKNESTTNKPTFLSSFNTGDRYPYFSLANSDLLSFQSIRDGNMEIFLSDSLMNYTKRITWNNVDEIHPWLSPDNKKIIFTEGKQETNKTKIALMNIDGSERRYITNDVNTYGAIPSFSYDGLKITYAAWNGDDKTGHFSNPSIVVYNLVTGKRNIITDDRYESWRPIFSPENERVFYISKEINNQFDVFEYSLGTKTKKNITHTDYEEWDPVISRDGNELLYSANKDGNWDLFLYSFRTDSARQLTNTIGDEWDPTFSPCGKYIYYSGTFGLHNGIYRLKFK